MTTWRFCGEVFSFSPRSPQTLTVHLTPSRAASLRIGIGCTAGFSARKPGLTYNHIFWVLTTYWQWKYAVLIKALKGYSYLFSYLNHKTYCTNPSCGKTRSVHLLTTCQILNALEHFLSESPLYHILFCNTLI
jgi:hypothetical protein